MDTLMEGLKEGQRNMEADSMSDFEFLPYPPHSKWADPDPGSNSDDEKKTLTAASDITITLNTSSSWTYCGPLLTLEEKSLPSSFHTWSRATINGSLITPLLAFLAFVHKFLEANHLEHYWLTIRATKGSTEYDIPRWHTDDLFFSPMPETKQEPRFRGLQSKISNTIKLNLRNYFTQHQEKQKKTRNNFTNPQALPINELEDHIESKSSTPTISPKVPKLQLEPTAQIISQTPNPPNWKLSTTLYGPGTIFINKNSNPHARIIQKSTKEAIRTFTPDHICPSIRCPGCASASETVRTRLSTDLKPREKVQARTGQCVFFRVGEEKGAMHSEPPSTGDRVFVNVVPGVEGDLRGLMRRWGMEFPRAWCFGVPFWMGEGEGGLRDVGEL